MKRKSIRTVALLTSLLIASTAFTGCGSSSAVDNKQDSKAPTEITEAADNKSETSENKNRLLDTEMTIKIMAAENPSQTFRADAPVFDEIYEKTGVRVELQVIPGSDWEQKARTVIATNNMPDVIMKAPSVKDYASSGVFLGISDYIDEYAPNFKKLMEDIPDIKKLYIDGKLYAFPSLARYQNKMGRVPMIRMDILEELGLQVPTSFDELYDVLKKMKEAYPDLYPWVNRNGTGNLFTCIAYSMGSGYGIYYDKDVDGGRYVYGALQPEFKEVLSYLNKMYEDKILDPDYAVATADQWKEKLSSGKAFFYFDNPSFAINFNAALKEENPEYGFGPMETLKNSKGQRRNMYYAEHWMESAVISSKVDRPEDVVKFMDWLYSEEGSDITNFGVAGKHYTKENGEYVVSQELIEKHSKDSDPWRGYMGELGTGLLGFSLYIDERNQWPFMSEETKSWYDLWVKDEAMDGYVMDPPFTSDETERLKEIKTKVDTILTNELDKYIMGEKPVDQFDSVVAELRKAGAEEIEKIYNDANNRVK